MKESASVQISDNTFDDWVRRYQRLLFRDRLLVDGLLDSDAEELTQEAFFQAYRSRSTLRDIEVVKGWLVGILRHCYGQMRRTNHSRAEIPLDEMANEPEDQNLLSRTFSPFINLLRGLTRDIVCRS